MSTTSSRRLEAQEPSTVRPARKSLRRAPQLLALEQRFMFDGAAVADLAYAAGDAGVLERISAVPAAVEVRAADPALDKGKKEAVLVDTSVADYKTLEAGIAAGMAIIEFDGSQDGLAQIAKWAQTQSGYDSISILSHGTDGQLHLGTTTLTGSSLSDTQVQSELAALGRALKAGGDLLLYGCDIAETTDGQTFIKDLSKAVGVDVAASSDATGNASRGGDWSLEYRTGLIEASALAATDYAGLLSSSTFDFETVAQGTDSKTISQTIGSDTLVITSTDANMLVDTELNAFGSNISNASGLVLASGEGGVFIETQLSLTVDGNKTFDLTSFTLAQLGTDGLTITLTTNKGSETFTASFVGNSWVLNLSTATHPSYFTGVTNVVMTTADPDGFFEWGFDNIVLSNITDPNAPPSTTVASASLQHDTGVSGTDFITNVASQTISGTLSNSLVTGELVEVSFDGGTNWTTATSSVGSADWSISTTLSGSNTFEARVTNGNGSSTAYSHTYTFDNVAPAITFSNLSLSNDSGTSSTDFITNASSQTITADLSGALGVGDKVYGSLDGGVTWADITSKVSGTFLNWSGATLSTSSTSISLKVSDTAGNDGILTNQSYTVDATAPATSIATAVFSSDTGTSGSDFITKTAAQTISGTLSANLASGESVWVSLNNGATWITATTTVGQNTWSLSGQTLSGSGTLKVRVWDTAGNSGTTFSQTYTLDTTAPSAPSAPDLVNGSDSGSSSTDNITSATTPTFSGTAEAGSIVTLYDTDGSTVLGTAIATGGNWSITSSSLSEGNHTITAKATDAAGNTSAASSGFTVTIDTTAPSGLSPSALSVATVSATSGATVATLSATDAHAVTYSLVTGNGSNDADNASFTIAGTALKVGGAGLTAGTYHVYIAATDAAGNASNRAITITVADAPIVISVAVPGNAAYRAGQDLDFTLNFSEAITVDTTSGTPRLALIVGSSTVYADYLSGSGTSALVFRYTVQAGLNDSDGITVGSLTTNGGTFRNGAGSDADLMLSSVASTTGVLVDSTAPTNTVASAAFSADTGTSSSDLITQTASQTISGTLASNLAAGESVKVSIDNGSSWVTATATVGQNSWSLAGQTLSGSSTLLVKVVDTAGNEGTAYSHSYAIDNTPPTAPSVDSQTSYSATPTLTGSASLASGETLSVTVGGATYNVTPSGGRWSLDLASATPVSGSLSLSLGHSYSVTATVLDAAGNSSSDASSNELSLVDLPPPSTAVSSVSLSDDTGSSSTDFITSAATQTLSGRLSSTLADGEWVEVSLDGGRSWNTASSSAGSSTWSTGATLAASGSIEVRVANRSGNGPVYTQSYTLDTSAPATPEVDSISTDSTAPVISGSATLGSGESMTVSVGGASYAVTPSAGRWQLDLASATPLSGSLALSQGQRYEVVATITDAAGNVARDRTSAELTIVLPLPPSTTVGSIVFSNDTGTSDQDLVTKVAAQTVSGTLSAALAQGERVEVSFDGGQSWQVASAAVGSKSWSIGTTLTGSQVLEARVSNIGGSSAVYARSYTLDTTAPSVSLSELAFSSDTGSSSTDFLTKDTAQTLTATLSTALAASDRLWGSLDNGAHWVDLTAKVAGTRLSWDGIVLTSSGTLLLKVQDAAGNEGAVRAQSYVLDTTAPAVSLSNLALVGGSLKDGVIVTTTSAQTLSANLSAALASGDTVYGSLDNGVSWTNITAKVTGTTLSWSGLTIATSGTLLIKVQDAAGNASTVATQSYKLEAVTTNSSNATTATVVVSTVSSDSTKTSTAIATLSGGIAVSQATTLTLTSVVANTGSSSLSHAEIVQTAPPVTPVTVGRPIDPIQNVAVGARIDFTLPADAFQKGSSDFALSATLSNGAALPSWLRFDAKTGKFVGYPPPGFRGEISIRVIARDSNGNRIQQDFKFQILGAVRSSQQMSTPLLSNPLASGRPGLGEQLLSTRNANADRVSTLAASAKAASLRRA